MKKILFILALILVMGCDEKEIKLYPSIEEGAEFSITTASFEKLVTIPLYQISEAINDVVEEGEIEKVSLEAIWMEIDPQAGNTATSVSLDLSIKSWSTHTFIKVVDDMVIPINNKPAKITLVQGLQMVGIDELKEQLNAIASGSGMDDLIFEAEGDVTPEGGLIDVNVKVFVRATIVYSQSI